MRNDSWPSEKGARIAICALVTLLGAITFASAQAPKPLKEQVLGTWTLASINNTRIDGTKYELFGPDASGLLILDDNGRYSLQIFRRSRPAFAGARMEGTAAENKAAVQGMISHFGTYKLNEDERSISFHIQSSSYPNWDKTEQKRNIVILVDQLSWSDPLPPTGPQSTDLRSDLVWLRVKDAS
jgi:hypothetical protein